MFDGKTSYFVDKILLRTTTQHITLKKKKLPARVVCSLQKHEYAIHVDQQCRRTSKTISVNKMLYKKITLEETYNNNLVRTHEIM